MHPEASVRTKRNVKLQKRNGRKAQRDPNPLTCLVDGVEWSGEGLAAEGASSGSRGADTNAQRVGVAHVVHAHCEMVVLVIRTDRLEAPVTVVSFRIASALSIVKTYFARSMPSSSSSWAPAFIPGYGCCWGWW